MSSRPRLPMALSALLAACAHPTPAPPPVVEAPPVVAEEEEIPPEAPPAPAPVHIELYVMSKCPYGTALENNFGAVRETLGPGAIDLDVQYIGMLGKNGKLTSMHGADELKGNLFQVCARRYSEKWFDVILCQNKDLSNIATNGPSCAKDAGIDKQALRDIVHCAGDDEGNRLLAASFERSSDRNAKASPTLYIEGREDTASRKPEALTRRICAAKPDEPPVACAKIAPAPIVNVVVLGDKRGADPKAIDSSIKSKLANAVITDVDYASPAGAALFAKIGPIELPAVVFDASLATDPEAAALYAGKLRHVADVDVMSTATWNPLCADDGGCARAECSQRALCRKETPKTLEVFVMSKEPFFGKALPHLVVALDNFKKHKSPITFSMHFIGAVDDKGNLSAPRGQVELEEDLRQVCAIEHYKTDDKFLDYALCRAKNLQSSDWESCVGGATGFSKDVIEKCSTGPEGQRLLTASFAASKAASISTSPTWLVNGKFDFSGLDAQKIKTSVCDHNAKLGGCDVLLPGP